MKHACLNIRNIYLGGIGGIGGGGGHANPIFVDVDKITGAGRSHTGSNPHKPVLLATPLIKATGVNCELNWYQLKLVNVSIASS